MHGTTEFSGLDFVLAPEMVSYYGAVTPVWTTLDAVTHAEEMIDLCVERELSLYAPWRAPKRARSRARRGAPRRRLA